MEYIFNRFNEGSCVYCNVMLERDSWGSHWCEKGEHHYKTVSCVKCGKKNWLQVDFQGSGHDPVLKKKAVSSLESTLRKVKDV